MKTEPRPLRLSNEDHQFLRVEAATTTMTMGKLLSKYILDVSIDDIVNAIKQRHQAGVEVIAGDKRTSYVMDLDALLKLNSISKTTGLSVDLLVRLIIEFNRYYKGNTSS